MMDRKPFRELWNSTPDDIRVEMKNIWAKAISDETNHKCTYDGLGKFDISQIHNDNKWNGLGYTHQDWGFMRFFRNDGNIMGITISGHLLIDVDFREFVSHIANLDSHENLNLDKYKIKTD
jgi:hypothetical protein